MLRDTTFNLPDDLEIFATKRCKLLILDAGPINSLWVANELLLLLKLNMPIILVDAVFDELTSDPKHYRKDAEVKQFIETNPPPFTIEKTETGRREREKRHQGKRPRRNAGEVAIVDFMSDGLEIHLTPNEPLLVLFEDAEVPGVRFFRKPSNLHLLSTVGLLRGLERVGVVQSADAIINKMAHPTVLSA